MMIKTLKKKLILSYLEKKKVKEPFDAEAAESFELPEDADINVNNSHFFTASSVRGETLSIRLGMRRHSEYEIFVLYRDGKRFLVHEKDSYPAEQCPVRFTLLETAKRWRIEFDGLLRDTATGEVKDARIDVEFEASFPIYDFIYHADQFNGMAESIAREKWNKSFFAELGKNNQRHYEQDGHIKGFLRFGGEDVNIDLPCVRDHSFGRREWDMMNDHIWFLGITEDAKVLSFSIVNYPRMKRIYSGYTDVITGEMQTLRDYEITRYDPKKGEGGDVLELKCHFPDNKVLDVSIRRDCNVTCRFGGGKYLFQEGLGDFTIAGQKGRGTIEYGFNADPSRWEGYSKL